MRKPYPGRYPAVVKSYGASTRTCRVEIPGITDGADEFPEAEIEYPVGDRSKDGDYSTEIEILSGDTVWVAFEAGDPRYPIITGFRNPRAGNSIETRRFHHANMELLVETALRLLSQGLIRIEANGDITIKASTLKIEAAVEITGSSLTHNGKDVGETHTHGGTQPGTGSTGVPN
jgi:hypothetical protein